MDEIFRNRYPATTKEQREHQDRRKLEIYNEAELQKIAETVNRSGEELAVFQVEFSSLAGWYDLDRNRPQKTAPSLLERKAFQLKGHFDRIISVLDEESDVRNAIYAAARREAALVDEGILSLRRIAGFCEQAIDDQRSMVSAPGTMDDAISLWLESIVGIYERFTGRPAGTSTDAYSGESGGPLIRFVSAAAHPIGIDLSPSRWRNRIREVIRKKI